jgi:uncharacterized protein YcbK (DUF882 family)
MKRIISRRSFIKLGILSATLPIPAYASIGSSESERVLAFHNLHTGESAKLVYWAEGQYIPDSLAEINHVLRDFRTGQVEAIDAKLLDLLHRVNVLLGTTQPFQVISGFRSPASNAMLVETTTGVARHSLHMDGKAIDVRISGIDLSDLRHAGLALRGGGVGYYPDSNFVHLDVGRVRTWTS